MEAFLSCGIPELHPQTLVLNVDCFGHEIDAHCRLCEGGGTCSLPVKLSKMNRFIIEVFPTDWSPRRTILHFTAGLFYIFSNYIDIQNHSHLINTHLSYSKLGGNTCEKGFRGWSIKR